MNPHPGLIETVKRVLGFTPKDVLDRKDRASQRLDKEVELTSECVRSVTEEIDIPPQEPVGAGK